MEQLHLERNNINNLTPLEGLIKLRGLHLENNPNLTLAEIHKLEKALPGCKITHDFE